MQDFNLNLLIDLVILGLMTALFLLFIFQSMKKQRKAFILTFGLIIGAIAALLSAMSKLGLELVLARSITSIFGLIFILGGILLTVIVYQIQQSRAVSPELHYIGIASLIIGVFLGLFGVLVEGHQSGNIYLIVIDITMYSFSYFAIYLFFEQLEAVRPDRVRLIFVITLLLGVIATGWLFLFDLNLISSSFAEVIENSWDFFYNALGTTVFLFGAYTHYKAYQFTKENKLLYLTIGAILIALGFVVAFAGDIHQAVPVLAAFFSLLGDLSTSLGDMIKLVGIIFFFLTYIRNIDYLYRIPVNIYAIMFFSSSGLSLYSARVENPIKTNENIISGMIVAISSFMKEAIGTQGVLQRITTQDRTFVFSSGKHISAAVLADRTTYFLQNSLRFATEELDRNLGHKIETSAHDLNELGPEVEKIFLKQFPYIRLVD